jgi:hypothetical protein
MKRTWLIVVILVALVVVGLVSLGPMMSNVEQPRYQVVSTEQSFELRMYEPVIIAEVAVKGERKQAISEGFSILADYIFGNNAVNEKISMTAPVEQQQSQKISMTAPVSQQARDSEWVVNFVMPSKYDLDTLPRPNNNQVNIRQIPSKLFAVVRFSGSTTNENVYRHEQKLQEYLSANKIDALSSPVYAFYNPPWTLPFMRRNEVMVEVDVSQLPTEKK